MLTSSIKVHDLLGRLERRRFDVNWGLTQQFRFTATALSLDLARFTPVSVVQVVSTTALSLTPTVNMMHGAGHGINSARSENGKNHFTIPV